MISKPLFSLDVQSLFTNVPIHLVLDFLQRKFDEGKIVLPNGMSMTTLIKLVRLCCKNTVFSFNSQFFEQIFGCPMGSPLSVILANLAMELLESELMSLFPIQPAFYNRFIDDTIGVWEHTQEEFDAFLEGLNGLIPSIIFTVE